MANRQHATSTNMEDYWQLFVNRRAYVLQSKRPHPESGRYYYFRPKAGKNGEPVSLTVATIRRHLEGDLTLGVYAINPATQRCKWIAMDGDYKESLKHLCELQWELQQQKVEAALEQSRGEIGYTRHRRRFAGPTFTRSSCFTPNETRSGCFSFGGPSFPHSSRIGSRAPAIGDRSRAYSNGLISWTHFYSFHLIDEGVPAALLSTRLAESHIRPSKEVVEIGKHRKGADWRF
jgi:hypothetical protein